MCVSCGSLKLLNRLLAPGKSVVMLVMFWCLLQDPSMLLLSLWGHGDALHLWKREMRCLAERGCHWSPALLVGILSCTAFAAGFVLQSASLPTLRKVVC